MTIGNGKVWIIGQSSELYNVLRTVKKASKSDASILIRGETGTGKELIAAAIHYDSFRRKEQFVKLNCAAIQDTLLESELFGHEKGSFTGANHQKKGKLEMANGGTLLLDEIGDMTPTIQSKVLRALGERAFERVGGTDSIEVDVRFISATNADLEERIEEKEFRKDLYYRLNTITIILPPLRTRKKDILPIAEYYCKLYSAELRRDITGFTDVAIEAMLDYTWPGNVRELQNSVERACILADEKKFLDEKDLDLYPPKKFNTDEITTEIYDLILDTYGSGDDNVIDIVETNLWERALHRTKNINLHASTLMGVSPRVGSYRRKKLKLPRSQRARKGSGPKKKGI